MIHEPPPERQNEREREKKAEKENTTERVNLRQEGRERVCVSHTANQAGMPRRCSCKGLIESTSPGRLTQVDVQAAGGQQQRKQKNASKPDS